MERQEACERFTVLWHSVHPSLQGLALAEQDGFITNPDFEAGAEARLLTCNNMKDRHYAVLFMMYVSSDSPASDFKNVITRLNQWLRTSAVQYGQYESFQLDILAYVRSLHLSLADFQRLKLQQGAAYLQRSKKASVALAAGQYLKKYLPDFNKLESKHDRKTEGSVNEHAKQEWNARRPGKLARVERTSSKAATQDKTAPSHDDAGSRALKHILDGTNQQSGKVVPHQSDVAPLDSPPAIQPLDSAGLCSTRNVVEIGQQVVPKTAVIKEWVQASRFAHESTHAYQPVSQSTIENQPYQQLVAHLAAAANASGSMTAPESKAGRCTDTQSLKSPGAVRADNAPLSDITNRRDGFSFCKLISAEVTPGLACGPHPKQSHEKASSTHTSSPNMRSPTREPDITPNFSPDSCILGRLGFAKYVSECPSSASPGNDNKSPSDISSRSSSESCSLSPQSSVRLMNNPYVVSHVDIGAVLF